MKSLAQRRQLAGVACRDQELILALEVGLIGQDRQARGGRRAHRPAPATADRSRHGSGPVLARPSESRRSGRSAPRRTAALSAWRSRGGGETVLAAFSTSPCDRAARVLATCARLSSTILASVSLMIGRSLRRSSSRLRGSPRPCPSQSIGQRGRRLPSGPWPCPAIMSAAALFNNTRSRKALRSPARTLLISPALCRASPPLSSASVARFTPMSSGAISLSVTRPLSSRATQLFAVVVSSSCRPGRARPARARGRPGPAPRPPASASAGRTRRRAGA